MFKSQYLTSEYIDPTQKIIMKEFGVFLPREALRNLIKKNQAFITINKEENDIAGVLVFNTKFTSVSDLIVVDKYRGNGIGRKLFEIGKMVTNTRGLRILATNGSDEEGKGLDSVGFWEKMGFKKTPRRRKTKKGFYLQEMYWGKVDFSKFKF